RGPRPQPSRLVLDDYTTETIAPTLRHNPRGVVVVKDELAGLINALNQYKGGRGSDRQVLLQLWSGSDIIIDRKSAPPLHIRRPFLAVVGGIQPAVLQQLRGTPLSRRTRGPRGHGGAAGGLPAPSLFAPPPLPPAQAETWSVLQPAGREAWQQALSRLMDQPLPPRLLGLSDNARAVWQRFT